MTTFPHRFGAIPRRHVASYLLILVGLVLLVLGPGQGALAQDETIPEPAVESESDTRPPVVYVLDLVTPVHPVAAEVLIEALAEADEAAAEALIVQLDTPGGLVTSMRQMAQAMLDAETPTVVYVTPQGAQAASAGFFLLMAADVAAMAPGTNTGAASPVGGGGEDIDGTMGKKVTEDSSAFIRSLAQDRGRDVEAAELTVTEARSYSADEAMEKNLIDVTSPTLTALLNDLEGFEFARQDGDPRILRTADAEIRRIEWTAVQRFLGVLVNPSIAALLLSLGSLGIMIEIYNPGSIFPGVLGAICLILGFYGLSILPINYAGVALLGLAALFFIAEIKITSYGLLSLAGVVCLVLGSIMLVKTTDPAMRVSYELITAMSVLSLLVVGFLATQVFRSRTTQVRSGVEGMVAERGEVRQTIDPRGKVFVHGEVWDARIEEGVEDGIARGAEIEVVAVDGLQLVVRALEPSAAGEPKSQGA